MWRGQRSDRKAWRNNDLLFPLDRRFAGNCGTDGGKPGNVLAALLQIQVARCPYVGGFLGVIGYAFAGEFNPLLGYMEKASWAVAGGMLTIGYQIWRRAKHRYKMQHRRKAA
jgi:hypothetical protein